MAMNKDCCFQTFSSHDFLEVQVKRVRHHKREKSRRSQTAAQKSSDLDVENTLFASARPT